MTASLLTDRERRTLRTVCDAFFPRLTPGSGDDARLFALSADDVALASAVEEALRALSRRQLRELRLFLRLLQSRAFMLVVANSTRGLCEMEPVARETTLLTLANSRLPQLRSGYQALKRLATFLFYSTLNEARTNPTWSALGYRVPEPHPAGAALQLTPVGAHTELEADACVIGSGAGGGVVAAALANAGMRVIVIEAGPGDQAADFDQHEVIGMQRLYLDQGTTASRDLSVSILAGSCIGGGTTVNWQTSLRLPDYVCAEWAERSGMDAFRNGQFQRALDRVIMRLQVGTHESQRNANNAPLERGCAALGYRWQDIPRNAQGCDFDQCGFCVFGCRAGGKQSTAITYLADAQRTGDCRIVAGCRALQIRSEAGRVTGVDAEWRGTESAQRVRVSAPLVVAACGAIETPALLLRSGIVHPELGRNLFLHPTSAVAGRYDHRIAGWMGAPQTVLCDELDRVRGNYGIRIEAAPIHPGLIALAQPWYGARDHRARMQHAAHVSAFVVITRDVRGGRVRIDREGRAVVHYAIGVQERALLQQGIAAAARVHHAAGASEIHTLHSRDHTFRRAAQHRSADVDAYVAQLLLAPVHANRCMVFSAHQMGTCRMGTQTRDSVCDERGAVRGVTGLYVADASLFPASSGVNPMITVMALAQLVGDAIAERGA